MRVTEPEIKSGLKVIFTKGGFTRELTCIGPRGKLLAELYNEMFKLIEKESFSRFTKNNKK